QDSGEDDDDRDCRSEVRLGDDERAEHEQEDADRPPQVPERSRRRPTREVGGGPNSERKLGELGRLERGRSDLDPAAGAVDALPDHEDREAEEDRRQDKRRREHAKSPVVETCRDHHQTDADQRVNTLLLEVRHRIRSCERCGCRGRAVDHHEPERDEAERDEDEQATLERLSLHRSASTSRRNVSPRSSKSRNWSKLAHAGDSRTTSPGSASPEACATAVARSPARRCSRSARPSDPASSSDASPIRWIERTVSGSVEASSSNDSPFSEPPRIRCSGASPYAAIPRRAAAVFVAFESFTYLMRRISATSSSRCSTPRNVRNASPIASSQMPAARAAAVAAAAFSRLWTPGMSGSAGSGSSAENAIPSSPKPRGTTLTPARSKMRSFASRYASNVPCRSR